MSFFGFSSDLPEDGGKLDEADTFGYNPDHDEDIDLVNDETFGEDLADDWEEEHERLAAGVNDAKYQGQEEDLEQSISHLVEDEDDVPAVMNKSESRQIPGRVKPNLDELFGPASPPAFLDTEHLVSPGKMDIWGSPTRPILPRQSPDDSGQRLLRMLQASKPQVHAVPVRQQLATGLSNAQSVEAIESDLKQILINKPHGFPIEDLRAPGSPQQGMPINRMPQLPHGMHTVMGRGSDRRSPPQFLPNASVPMNMMGNRFNTPPPAMHQMRFRGMMSPAAMQQRMQGHSSFTDPRDMRQRPPMYHRPQMPLRPPQFNNHDRHHNGSHDQRHHYRQYERHHQEPSAGDQRPHDEYAGLMTQKEKDWVIKIQLIQLHTDNPYIDDYYYTTHSMRKLAKEKERVGDQPGNGSTEPKLLLPAMAKVETRTYTPVTFAGSLGKLTTSSVHKPRQILDVGRSSSVGDEEEKTGAKDMRKIRKLLIDIEKLYDILLQIDDLEKKVLSMPEDGREPLLLERKTCINDMYSQLNCLPETNDQFIQIACVRKGLKLIGRILLLLDKVQASSVISAILRNFAIIAKKDQQNNVLPPVLDTVLRFIKSFDFPRVVQLSQDLINNSGHKAALQNKFGVSVIFHMVKCAESQEESTENITQEHKDNWSLFLKTIAETIVALPEKNLAQSLQPCSNVVKQFESVIGGKLLDNFEQRIIVMVNATRSS